jgi:O-antigen/teichoic acid export membrane protein
LNSTFENTSNCSTNFTINASNSYVVWLDLDHAVLGKENDSYTYNLSMPLYFYVTPTAVGSGTWIDNMFTVLLGENPLSWINLISYILAIVILMTFSVFNAPLGLIGSGFALGFLNIYLSFSIITIGLCTFLIVLGILGLAKQYTSGVRR